ncbi:MAG: sulfotransferase [Proteobacteria bacterium]|jgi:hypothetical protein|nr:sulfotransferase [Pseudomonadota bacterium]
MPRQNTVQNEEYRPHIKALNRFAGAVMRLGFRVGELDADSICDEARRRTGLTDWGDEEFLGRLDRLVELSKAADITHIARIILRQTCVQAVANRLKMEHYLKENPQIILPKIERPIFVLGFPRTGTTLLQNLLSLEEGRRALQFWEIISPVPVCDDPVEDRRRRIKISDRMLRMALVMAPEMQAVHEIHSTTAEECWPLFWPTFAVLSQDLQSGIGEFGDYLMNNDMTHAYRYYKRTLQVLLHQRPATNVVLKCPEHLWFIDSLLEAFPDACIVWTHRDPADSIASYCSLISLSRRMLFGRFDPRDVGDHISKRFLTGVQRAMKAREGRDPSQFLDIDFATLVKDPARQIRQINSYFGLPQSEQTEVAVQRWLDTKREDSRGSHVYSADRYGLNGPEIHEKYAEYIDGYSVSLRTAAK